MENLKNLISEIKGKQFKITKSSKGEMLQQTQRNELKHALLQALLQDLASEIDFVGLSADGIMVEIPNDSIADNIENESGSGAITCTIDIKINGLEFNFDEERKNYEIDQKEKADKKAKNEKAKAEKIAQAKKERGV